jgi:hypothetical protein
MDPIVIAVIVIALIALGNRKQEAQTFVCPVDGLIFPSQAELEAHMVVEHPGVRFPIQIKWS